MCEFESYNKKYRRQLLIRYLRYFLLPYNPRFEVVLNYCLRNLWGSLVSAFESCSKVFSP